MTGTPAEYWRVQRSYRHAQSRPSVAATVRVKSLCGACRDGVRSCQNSLQFPPLMRWQLPMHRLCCQKLVFCGSRKCWRSFLFQSPPCGGGFRHGLFRHLSSFRNVSLLGVLRMFGVGLQSRADWIAWTNAHSTGCHTQQKRGATGGLTLDNLDYSLCPSIENRPFDGKLT